MSTEPIYLSTRAAARLAGCEPHVLYTAYRRHGSFRGVVPRKGTAGRLSWPADELRAAVLPPAGEWPDGAALFVEWAEGVAPESDQRTLYVLGLALFGSEAAHGWQPSPGQLSDERLTCETKLAGMFTQALGDRIDQARTATGRDVAADAVDWLASVTRNALRYLTRDDKRGAA